MTTFQNQRLECISNQSLKRPQGSNIIGLQMVPVPDDTGQRLTDADERGYNSNSNFSGEVFEAPGQIAVMSAGEYMFVQLWKRTGNLWFIFKCKHGQYKEVQPDGYDEAVEQYWSAWGLDESEEE